MNEASPSQQLILQRIRNRIIEHLETLASFDAQRDYQLRVPKINVPYELINGWEDWVDGPAPTHFVEPVFSAAEREVVAVFHAEWNRAASDMPDTYPSLSEVQAAPYWSRLRDAAERALMVFEKRGKLSEEVELCP
jgi:hypothetical protein